MKYKLVNCKIAEGTNGSVYLATMAVSERNTDNGFSLPMFNPGFIAAARECIQNELPLDKYITDYFNSNNAVIEDRTVKLGAVYFRREQDENGKVKDTPVVDKATGKPIPYDSVNLHCIYSLPTEDAYDPATGTILTETVYINGVANTRPKRKYVLDEATGKPKKEYWQGWSAQERRDQVLKMFYILAPREYQTISGPESSAQPEVAPQPQAGAAPQNPFNAASVAPNAQQGAAAPEQVTDPLNGQQSYNNALPLPAYAGFGSAFITLHAIHSLTT